MEDRIYDSNLILNKVFNDGNFDVRQDSDNILNAVYSADDNALKVNVTNLPTGSTGDIKLIESNATATADNVGLMRYHNTTVAATYAQMITRKGWPTIVVVADNVGDIGNSITFEADGIKTISTLVSEWNIANPTNTATVIEGGSVVLLDTILIFSGGDDDGYKIKSVDIVMEISDGIYEWVNIIDKNWSMKNDDYKS